MRSIYSKSKSWIVGLGICMGLHAYGGSVTGELCFTQAQVPGPVREEQIVSFEAFTGSVSPSNTQQSNEKLNHYLHRMNEPLRTISPDVFKKIEHDINNLKAVIKSSDVPILVDDYKSRNFSTSYPCYIVPLAHTDKENSGKITIVLSPFSNIKKLSTNISAVQWFSIANSNYLSIANYLEARSAGFKKSPTVTIILNRLYSKSIEINIKTIQRLCSQNEFTTNKLCQDSSLGKIITDSNALLEKYNSIIIEKCIREQGGSLQNKNKLDECLSREKENRTFGKSVARSYKELEEMIKKGSEHTFNGVFTLVVLAPLHPVVWMKYNNEAQSEINVLLEDLAQIPVEDFFQLRNALVQHKNEMIQEMQRSNLQNIEFISQSNLTSIQKQVLVSKIEDLILSGLFFENMDMNMKEFNEKLQSSYGEIYGQVGFQYIWP